MGGEQFWAGLAERAGRVFAHHPELVDHRATYPWLLGALGDPFAAVWFVAENPSLTQVRKFDDAASPDSQWAASAGDRLLRQALVLHGFKRGDPMEPGGWQCYITDVIKSADVVGEWRRRPEADRTRIAEAWAPVLAYELERGAPQVLAVMGKPARELLAHLERRRLVPKLPPIRPIYHYSYLGSRPESSGLRRGPGNPDRIAEWHRDFADLAVSYPAPS
jgi:hypothetical protein